MLSQIYILCYFPSEVTFKSQEIPYFLYCSQWVQWNKLNRKLTLLMMTRFDLPIYIRSINPTYIFNLAAFTSVSFWSLRSVLRRDEINLKCIYFISDCKFFIQLFCFIETYK